MLSTISNKDDNLEQKLKNTETAFDVLNIATAYETQLFKV